MRPMTLDLTPRDRLRELIDVVVASVDEPDEPERLAARVHLSRFHFDRLVSAALGEPPLALRRRLLLERAGWLLLARDELSVTEIGLHAGYASSAAFSRAFRRAHGTSPSLFRRAAGRWRLAAPNGVHFHPPAGLLLPGREKGHGMDLIDRLIGHDLWLTAELLERAATLDDEQLDRPLDPGIEPLDDDPTIRSTLERLVHSKEVWTAAIEGRPAPDDRDDSIEGLRRRLAAAGPAWTEVVAGIRERGSWDTAFVDAICEPPETFTFGGMVAHVLTFSAHRRTLLVGALHGLGIGDLGSGDPIAWERSVA
jgi:AraC-like DNA-binding protein